MAKTGKYFRMSEQAVHILENRDRKKYPYEVDLIEAGLLASSGNEKGEVSLELILEEIQAVKEDILKLKQVLIETSDREEYPLPKL